MALRQQDSGCDAAFTQLPCCKKRPRSFKINRPGKVVWRPGQFFLEKSDQFAKAGGWRPGGGRSPRSAVLVLAYQEGELTRAVELIGRLRKRVIRGSPRNLAWLLLQGSSF